MLKSCFVDIQDKNTAVTAKSKVKKLPNKKKSPALAKTIAELDKENTVPPYISHGIKIDGITLSYSSVLKVLKNF